MDELTFWRSVFLCVHVCHRVCAPLALHSVAYTLKCECYKFFYGFIRYTIGGATSQKENETYYQPNAVQFCTLFLINVRQNEI